MNLTQYGIAWNDSYRLGDEKVDAQHRRIFEISGELVKSCIDGSDSLKLQNILQFLADYTVRHFYDEESLQLQCGYPEYEKHKQLHDEFKLTMAEIVRKFKKYGSSTELSRDVNLIILNWLVNHIIKEDQKIGEYLRRPASPR